MSQEACAAACAGNLRCNAFEWYSNTVVFGQCHIYTGEGGTGGTSLNKVTQGGGHTSWSAECYLYCGDNSQSVEGSAHCVCNKGYQSRGGACEACPVGTYKASMGDSDCEYCPEHSSTHLAGIYECNI